MMDLLKYLNARLGEASTLAGITGLLALLHVHVDPGVVKDITLYAPLVTGVLSILLADVSAKKTPAAVAQDVLAGVLAALPAVQQAPAVTPAASPQCQVESTLLGIVIAVPIFSTYTVCVARFSSRAPPAA